MTRGDDELDQSSVKVEQVNRDRAAILARRRRFMALALTGIATAGCTSAAQPAACLSIAAPDDETQPIDESEPSPNADGPFVEDPGQPVQSTDPEGEGDSGAEQPRPEPRPQACLKMVQPKPKPCLKKAAPRPCLDVAAPPAPKPTKTKPPPQPCLLMIDVD